jgi:RNA polymerase sigma-70 factor, ECF subfamily
MWQGGSAPILSGAAPPGVLTFQKWNALQEVKADVEMDVRALSDNELALALKAGDRSAFDELVTRHQGRVYAVAYRFTGNREDALDVAQEALLKACSRIDAWRPTGGFVPWLMRITTNQAIDHLRRAKRRRCEPLSDENPAEGHVAVSTAPGMDPERRARAKEIGARVQEGLVALSPAQRTVFVLRHYEGLSLAEISESMGCTVGSVKVHLFRALRKMRAELGEVGEF